MSIKFQNREYRVGPAAALSKAALRGYSDAGSAQYANQNCIVLKQDYGDRMLLRVQHVNSQWPTYYPLKTQTQILENWS